MREHENVWEAQWEPPKPSEIILLWGKWGSASEWHKHQKYSNVTQPLDSDWLLLQVRQSLPLPPVWQKRRSKWPTATSRLRRRVHLHSDLIRMRSATDNGSYLWQYGPATSSISLLCGTNWTIVPGCSLQNGWGQSTSPMVWLVSLSDLGGVKQHPLCPNLGRVNVWFWMVYVI